MDRSNPTGAILRFATCKWDAMTVPFATDSTGSVPADTMPAQRIAAWLDLMRTCEKLLLAGLRREIGPEGDHVAAYRQWLTRHREEHDQIVERMCRQFNR